MELVQLTRAMLKGTADLMAMKRAGTLKAEHLWVAEDGAEEYIRAIATGDLAHAIVKGMRMDECAGCPGKTASPSGKGLGYCGPPFEIHLDGPVEGRTCGCLVEGKTAVASERCPRGKW